MTEEVPVETPLYLRGGEPTPESIRALVDKIFETVNNGKSVELMVVDLSLLAGLSCSILLHLARKMERAQELAPREDS